MFQKTRLGLTLWYVIISMTLSLIFSFIIFTLLTQELSRNERRLELRLDRVKQFNPDFDPDYDLHRKEIDMTESRIKLQLIYINVGILAIAFIAGYLLSGISLKPIEEAMEKQNQFIADASHELKTPLTAMRTSIEVNLRDDKLDLNEAKSVLKENLEDVDKLKSLSENLLTLASIQKGKKDTFKNESLITIIEESIEKVKKIAKSKNIKIKKNLREAVLIADKQRLSQLFVILLDNAIKYSSKNKQIDIFSEIIDSKVKVTIKDQGIGIDRQDIDHIFERFYRADKSRSDSKAKGYGLGLAIAKEIANLHKGNINVISKKNQGSSFIVILPLSSRS